MALHDCLDAIKKAGGDTFTDAEIMDVLERLMNRRERMERAGDTVDLDRKLAEAARDEAKAAKRAAIVQRKRAIINALRHDRLTGELESMGKAGLTPVKAMLAQIHGMTKRAPGVRASAWRTVQAYEQRYLGGVIGRIEKERPDLLKRLLAKEWSNLHPLGKPSEDALAFNARIAREMEEMRPGGEPGVTGDKDALWIARLYRDMLELSRRDSNNLGADIGKLDGYVPHSHDGWRMIRSNEGEWLEFIKPKLDIEKTFPDASGDAEIDDVLRQVYRTVTSGRDLDATPAQQGIRTGPASLAKRLEHSRVLHFKPGQWEVYSSRYGHGTLTATVFHNLRQSARINGLMDKFGSNPELMLKRLADDMAERIRRKGPVSEADNAQIKQLQGIKNWASVQVMTGAAQAPGSTALARLGSNIRAWEVLSKLMGAALSAMPDPGMLTANLRFQGKPFLETYAQTMRGFLRGRGRGEERHIAFLLGEGFDSMIDNMVTPYAAFDMPTGRLSRLATWGIKISGLSAITDISRSAAVRIMSADMGRHASKGWDELPLRYRNVLELQGIRPEQWEVARQAVWTGEDGRVRLTPDRIGELDNDAIMPLASERLEALESGLAKRVEARRRQDAREAEWVRKRIEKFQAKLASANDRFQEYVGRSEDRLAARVEELEARADLMRARAEQAEALETILTGQRGLMNQEAVRRFLEAVEDGRRATDVAVRSNRRMEGDVSAAYNRGVALGQRIGGIEARIRELEQRAKKVESDADRAIVSAGERMKKMLQAREAEVVEFIDRMKGRAEQRAQADAKDKVMQPERINRLIEETRLDLEMTFRGFFADEASYSNVETDWRTQKVTTGGGLAAGTWAGEAMRLFMQFKSFPISFTHRVLGRALFQQPGATPSERLLRAGGSVVETMAVLFTLGLLARWAKDIASGRSPRELIGDDGVNYATVIAALMQGGGLGIYGDFLFAEYNRFGKGPLETLSGPGLGDIAGIISLIENVRNGEPRASRFLNQAIGLTPFINLWYTRAAVDWLFLLSLREAAAPGFLGRQEKRMWDESRQERLVEPLRPFG